MNLKSYLADGVNSFPVLFLLVFPFQVIKSFELSCSGINLRHRLSPDTEVLSGIGLIHIDGGLSRPGKGTLHRHYLGQTPVKAGDSEDVHSLACSVSSIMVDLLNESKTRVLIIGELDLQLLVWRLQEVNSHILFEGDPGNSFFATQITFSGVKCILSLEVIAILLKIKRIYGAFSKYQRSENSQIAVPHFIISCHGNA